MAQNRWHQTTGAVAVRPGTSAAAKIIVELEEHRAAQGLTFSALAKVVDRPVSTVHGWLSGTHAPYPQDRETLIAILQELKIDRPRHVASLLASGRRGLGPANQTRSLEGRVEELESRLDVLEAWLSAGGTQVDQAPTPLIG